jgi:lipopolysaccharide biosynthesis glycosyltransferase
MASKAICYVTDIGYLFPSIVSAISIRRHTGAEDVQVYIFALDVDDETIAAARKKLGGEGLEFVHLKSSLFSGFDKANFNQTHVPIASLGRFFIEDMLPPSTTEVIYIDGDTLGIQDLKPLIDAVVPEGRFLAAEDISSFCRNDISPFGQAIKSYFQGIGVGAERGYFNAGVFKVNRRTWKALSREAFDYFAKNTKVCRYHDQSALNAIVQDRRLILSTKYNFQTPYLFWGVESKIAPALYHFTQSMKPWMADCPPWGRFHKFYKEFEGARRKTALPMKTLSSAGVGQHTADYRKQLFLLYGPGLPRLLGRRKALQSLERDAFLK